MTACRSPTFRGCVGPWAGRVLLLQGAFVTYQDFHGHGGFLSGCLTPAGCPVLWSPFRANHTLAVSSRQPSIFPVPPCFKSCPTFPRLREGKPLGRPPAEISPVLQDSMGLIKPDYFRSLSLGLEPSVSQDDVASLALVQQAAVRSIGGVGLAFVWAVKRREGGGIYIYIFFFKIF